MGDSIKTILVTDVPFWNRNTGAHARITQLAENLQSPPFDTRVLVTQTATKLNPTQPVLSGSLLPIQFDLTQPPAGSWQAGIRWRIAALAHSIGWRPAPHRPTFDHYYPQLIVDRFVEFVSREKPDIILFEYATQIQLLRQIPRWQRKRMVAVLDSHDILWKRARQFAKQGQDHWIDVDQQTEEKALKEFDLVLAIGWHEARYFEQLIGQDQVIVTSMEFETNDSAAKQCPHSNPDTQTAETSTATETSGLKIGHLASENWANLDAVTQIIESWPSIAAHHPNVEFVLAGGICNSSEIKPLIRQLPHVKLLGPVSGVDDFYRHVDLVWNPIRFGTGLKIKNLEAMSRAKCLVTSPHGSQGLLPETPHPEDGSRGRPFVTLESAVDLDRFLQENPKETIIKIGLDGQNHVKKHFGIGTQFPRLRQKLESLIQDKSA